VHVIGEASDDRVGVSRECGPYVGGYLSGEIEAGANQIDSLAEHRDALAEQQSTLALSFGDAPVGANDALPRKFLLRGRQHAADEPGRLRVDLAIGAHRTLRDLPDAADDAGYAFLVRGGIDLRLTFHVNRVQNAAPPVVIASAFWTRRLVSFEWKVRSKSPST